MWDLIVSVPDHCLSFYFKYLGLNISDDHSWSKHINQITVKGTLP